MTETGDRCTASSWRGHTRQPYGPGGYNRCVLTDHPVPGQHKDDFGNVFVTKPKFKVIRHEKSVSVEELLARPASGVALPPLTGDVEL